MTSNQNICYCGEYGGGVHTKSARCTPPASPPFPYQQNETSQGGSVSTQTLSSKKVSRPKLSDRLTDDDYLARLKSKCIITESGCWEKQGFRSISKGMEHHGPERGYGHMSYRGRRWAAHRLSWLLTRGLIPAGSVVMHKCDNPPCCNPDHLELGTDKQNMQEAGKRKRWPRQYSPTCKHGHPRTPENVIYHGREKKMRCRICCLTKWRRAAGWPEHLLTIPKVPNGYSHEQVTRNAT